MSISPGARGRSFTWIDHLSSMIFIYLLFLKGGHRQYKSAVLRFLSGGLMYSAHICVHCSGLGFRKVQHHSVCALMTIYAIHILQYLVLSHCSCTSTHLWNQIGLRARNIETIWISFSEIGETIFTRSTSFMFE